MPDQNNSSIPVVEPHKIKNSILSGEYADLIRVLNIMRKSSSSSTSTFAQILLTIMDAFVIDFYPIVVWAATVLRYSAKLSYRANAVKEKYENPSGYSKEGQIRKAKLS